MFGRYKFMEKIYEKLILSLKAVRKRTDFIPKIAIVLGSGLGSLADEIELAESIPYSEIEGFPVSTVSGHAGRFVFGYIDNVPVVIMQGRVHYYEGYDMADVVMPIRLMGLMGAKCLFLTNAAGGINTSFYPGCLMMIRDHLSFAVPSPLRGANVDELGTRFPDMSGIYSERLQKILVESAEKLGIELFEGVYIQTPGPNYETPAEIHAYRTLGADAAGMSTACEAIAAHHMGLEVCGVSCISNLAAGMSDKKLAHDEVKETAERVSSQFKKLIRRAVSEAGKLE